MLLCLYLELLWSAFSCIRSEYEKMPNKITPNTDTFHAVWTNKKKFEKVFFSKEFQLKDWMIITQHLPMQDQYVECLSS